MKKQFLLVTALLGGLLLSACGGGGDGAAAPKVATSDATLAVNATTGPAIARGITNEDFKFTRVPEFGTTATTTVTVTASNTATPTFTVTEAGSSNTASGVLGFGSCIFTVTSSTFPASSPLALGKTVTITPCEVTVALRGTPATGASFERSAVLKLGGSQSNGDTFVTIAVDQNGNFNVNGQSESNVNVQETTGGGG